MTIEDPCVTSEPLASGGSASLASCPDRVGSGGPFAPGDVAARPAEKEDAEARALPPLDPEEAAAIADAEAEIEEEVETPQLGPRPPEAQVLDLVGGSVSVTLLEDAIVLNAATPKPGFVADLSFERADELTITFWNGTTLYAVVASITADGELDLAWEETGR